MLALKMETEEVKMDALRRWAAEIGISDAPSSSSIPSTCPDHCLLVSHFPDAGGRGLAAARNLRRGEVVLRVPRAALLTRESVLRDEKLASCVRKHSHLSSSQILTICLLAEVAKGRLSWWYPYLVLLPWSYNTLANFREFEINALQVKDMAYWFNLLHTIWYSVTCKCQVEDAIWVSEKAVVKARSDWREGLLVMRDMMLKPQLLSFGSWLWASATISSRTLHIPWDDAGCLCPVGDLFNYAAPDDEPCDEGSYNGNYERQLAEPHDSWTRRLTDGGYDEDSASYCFYAKKNYRKGEQVLLSYGTYTNLDLLQHYGFLLSSNSNDKAFLQLDIDANISNTWPKDSLYIQPDGEPSFALLCALRLGTTPLKLRREVGHAVYAGSLISNENEVLVMKKLAKTCSKVLEELPTTMKDDILLLRGFDSCLDSLEFAIFDKEMVNFLQANGLQQENLVDGSLTAKTVRSLERWRLAVNWRLGYKRILSNCISYCNKVIGEMS